MFPFFVAVLIREISFNAPITGSNYTEMGVKSSNCPFVCTEPGKYRMVRDLDVMQTFANESKGRFLRSYPDRRVSQFLTGRFSSLSDGAKVRVLVIETILTD